MVRKNVQNCILHYIDELSELYLCITMAVYSATADPQPLAYGNLSPPESLESGNMFPPQGTNLHMNNGNTPAQEN